MRVRFRLMTIEDIPEAMQLKDSAGWNQTAADWARFPSATIHSVPASQRQGGRRERLARSIEAHSLQVFVAVNPTFFTVDAGYVDK